MKEKDFRLPSVLNNYKHSDHITQQKVRFVYYLILAAIVGLFFLTVSSIFIQLNSPEYNGIHWLVILPMFLLTTLYFGCFILLIKGKYILSSHLLVILSMMIIWYTIWTDLGDIVTRIDTLVLIIALINLIPLFAVNYKRSLIIYSIVNLIALIVFIKSTQEQFSMENATAIDVIIDMSIAIIFSGIVGYNIFNINNQSIKKLEKDNLQRLKAEKALVQSELLRKNVFDSSKIPTVVMDLKTFEYIDINPAAVKVYGFPSVEASLGKTPIDVSALTQYDGTPSAEKAPFYIKRAIQEGSVTFEWLHRRPNGEYWDAEVHLLCFKSDEKPVLQFSLIDITEKKKVAKELKESEEQYKTLIETSKDGISLMDLNGNMIYVNRRKVEMFGAASNNDLIEKNTFSFFKDKSHLTLESMLPEILQKGFIDNIQAKGIRADGSEFPAEINFSIVKNSEGSPLYLMDTIRDISRRTKALDALKESELKYRSLMENMNDIVMLVDNDDRIQYVNKRFCEKLGYSEEEIIGEIGHKILVSLENQHIIIKANQKRLKNQESQYEVKLNTKDGRKIDFLISGAPVKNAEGIIIGSIGNMMDITERKQTEKALKESQQLFKNLALVSPVGIFRTKADGYTTYVNPTWIELSGLTFEEAIGNGWLKAVHPDDRQLLSDNWELHSKEGEKSVAEYRFIKPDGSIVWVLGSAVPELEDDEITGYIGTITDITERKITEKELKESEEKNRTIIEAFPDIIMISDLKGNIIFANEALERITGITPDDYNNINRKAKIHQDDLGMIQVAIVKLLKGTKNHTDIIENRFIDIYGKEHWFSGIISKLKLNNKIVLQTISRDITERKQIEKELEKHRNHLEILVKERTEELATSNEELLSTNEELHNQREELEAVLLNLQNAQKQLVQAEKMASLGILAAGVAHEINNPLNFIQGGVFGLEQYLNDNLKEHKDKLLPLIDGMNIGIERAAKIVTSLNHYSRKDDSKIIICGIHSIVDNCLVILRNQIKDRIEVNTDYAEEKQNLFCNEGKLHQAILNILSNAVHSIKGEGVIDIKTTVAKQKLNILVTDTGCGISKENMPKIFDPFFTTKEAGKGTGLGLSITYNIIEEHNGTIEFDSKVGTGTKVKVVLPLKKDKNG